MPGERGAPGTTAASGWLASGLGTSHPFARGSRCFAVRVPELPVRK